MKKQYLLFLLAITLMICFGCKKDSASADFATTAVGIYSGTWNVSGGNYSGTCEVTKVTDNTVKLTMAIMGSGIPGVPDVKLSSGGNGKINLNYSDTSGNVSGTIQGKTIAVSITDGTTTFSFSGTKP